jgi:hypothetical protein
MDTRTPEQELEVLQCELPEQKRLMAQVVEAELADDVELVAPTSMTGRAISSCVLL